MQAVLYQRQQRQTLELQLKPRKPIYGMWRCKESDEKAWGEKSVAEKAWTVFSYFFRLCAVLGLLYLFIVSLGTMGDAFQIIAGPTAGEVFRNNEIFDNPIAGLVIGILATVLVQSSSTSTSIIISMTASNLMEVKNAIPMIMGANIGTSVTNTIVSVFQVGDKNQYRRAFAGATVHDCFNILTVVVLLPIEAIFGMLREIAEAIIGDDSIDSAEDVDFIKELTDPVKKRIVSVDKKLVTKVAEAETQEKLDELLEQSMIKQKRDTGNHFFLDTGLSDQVAGWMLLFVALVILSTCLLLLVKVSRACRPPLIPKHNRLISQFNCGCVCHAFGLYAIEVFCFCPFVPRDFDSIQPLTYGGTSVTKMQTWDGRHGFQGAPVGFQGPVCYWDQVPPESGVAHSSCRRLHLDSVWCWDDHPHAVQH